MGWAGFNCSLPHKVAVIEHLDGLGKSAAIMGAVNCAVRRGNRYIGENTDGKGFLQSLRELVDPAGKSLVMFGAGGAARAIGVETRAGRRGAITVVNRDRGRGARAGRSPEREDAGAGDARRPGPGDYRSPRRNRHRRQRHLDRPLPGCRRAARPRPRSLQARHGRRRRHPQSAAHPACRAMPQSAAARVLDGLGMLVNQGVIGIKYWTGVDVDPPYAAQASRALRPAGRLTELRPAPSRSADTFWRIAGDSCILDLVSIKHKIMEWPQSREAERAAILTIGSENYTPCARLGFERKRNYSQPGALSLPKGPFSGVQFSED